MKHQLLTVLVIFLSISIIFAIPRSGDTLRAHAQTVEPPRLEVWSPDVHSSNITDPNPLPIPSIFPPGKHITVLLNLTQGGPIASFDIMLNYNISSGPNVLQLLSATTAGGLFDPSNAPSGCVIHNLPGTPKTDFPPGTIRFGAYLQGQTASGPCSVDGTNGTLFSMIFNVTSIGSGSIDIVQGNGNGSSGSTIEGEQGGVANDLNFTAYSAYFKNAPGIPPLVSFTFSPDQPVAGQTVTYDGTSSFDPDASTAPNHGTGAEAVIYDSNNNKQYDTGDIVVLGPAPPIGTRLSSDPSILYNDQNSNGHYDSGETVIDNTSGKLYYQAPDVVIAGTPPIIGQRLTTDAKLLYVDTHANQIWDNGYVWSFGDGSSELTGNVTSHIFIFSGTLPSAGIFPVKLTVYDADDNLAMRKITLIVVQLAPEFSVSISLTLSSQSVDAGVPVNVTLRLSNRGNRPVSVDLDANYSLAGGTALAVETGIAMPIGRQIARLYTIQTGSLSPGSYTIHVHTQLFNMTSGEPIPYTNPLEDHTQTNFVVVSPVPSSPFNVLFVAGIGIAAVVAVGAIVFLLRRRKKEEV